MLAPLGDGLGVAAEAGSVRCGRCGLTKGYQMFNKIVLRGVLATALVASAATAQADSINVFNMPSGETSLDFVTVGDPGNAADPTTGRGAVGYDYKIGTYDVTTAQYCQFLNAVAATYLYSLYLTQMASAPSLGPSGVGCGIIRTGISGTYTYYVPETYANLPVNWISWGDAARFCNWLQNGQHSDSSTTENGAYTLAGHTDTSYLRQVLRNPGATYFIPFQDEWYKAAYYKGQWDDGLLEVCDSKQCSSGQRAVNHRYE